MINNFIKDVCTILNINIPKISFNTSDFTSKTMIMACKENTIYLKPEPNKFDYDYYFGVAHELRHLWQIENDEEFYFSDYKPREQCDSIRQYNMQPAEIDAHAFAKIIMVDLFNVTPLFNGFDKDIIDMIDDRIEWIVRNE